jgi:hypothetical protein
MIYWDIYQVNSEKQNLIGVKFRGTLRKYSVEKDIVLLAENAQDEENTVRFALIVDTYEKVILDEIVDFIKTIITDAVVEKILPNTPNPILSKLKNNDLSRY